jgi:pentapeptide repeat protein
MISHRVTRRPEKWATLVAKLKHRWMIPFRAFEWLSEWVAYALSHWSFLEVLEYLGSFSVLIGVIFYFSESGDRIKQRHYQAWQVINTAQGKGGSGGRIEALQELNEDKIQLVGVDVSSAFLQGVHLEHANLLRADLSAADLRGSDFRFADLAFADLHAANFRGSNLENASFSDADLKDADLVGANLAGAKLDRVDLTAADLRSSNLEDVQWKEIRSIKSANIAGVKAAPDGFIQWALQNGAVYSPSADE